MDGHEEWTGRASRWSGAVLGALVLASCATAAPESAGTTVAPTVAPTTLPASSDAASTNEQDAAPVVDDPCDFEELDLTVDEEIRFAPGTSGTTVSEALEANELHAYSLEASAGQEMNISMSGGALVNVYDEDFTLLASGSVAEVTSLPVTGTYFLDVVSGTCAALTYDMIIEIPASGATGGGVTPTPSTAAPGGGGESAEPCPRYTDFTTATAQDWPMRLCHQGPLVREVQQGLRGLGFDVTVDGFFGPGTANAVGNWRGDGIGELIPSDLEALVPRDERDEEPASETPTPPDVRNSFITLTAGVDLTESIDLVAGDRLQVALLDGGDGTDPILSLVDPNGTTVAVDDDSGQGPLDSAIDVNVGSTGRYLIVATSINGVTGMAQLQVIIN